MKGYFCNRTLKVGGEGIVSMILSSATSGFKFALKSVHRVFEFIEIIIRFSLLLELARYAATIPYF